MPAIYTVQYDHGYYYFTQTLNNNSNKTSQLWNVTVLNIFCTIGAEIHPYDIDLAHRVTPRQAAEGRPKPIVCKFTRHTSFTSFSRTSHGAP